MSLPMEILISNLHYPRRLLLLNTPFFHSPQTATTPSPTQSPTTDANTNSFDANVVMILSVLICAIICSLFVNSLIKCVIRCTSLVNGEPNYYLNMVNHKKKLSSGVDKRALRTFPVVKYCSDKIIQGLGTECVICLSEFKEGEKVRILPKCNHGFHVKCIDKWLGSHSSCPTCRQSLIDTCHKIIGSDNNTTDHQAPAAAAAADSVVTISIVPLERENMVRNNQL